MTTTVPVEGSDRYLNRELSWLSFAERVLALAGDPTLPLLERTRLLAIFADGLDEFFQVRVAGLKEQVAHGVDVAPPDGLPPRTQLAEIRQRVVDLYDRQSKIFTGDLAPGLAAEGIQLSNWHDLDDEAELYLQKQFREKLFPVLTPLAVDPAHPFPYISDLSLNLAVFVADPKDHRSHFARVKVPPILPRFVTGPLGRRFVPLEQVIGAHLGELFPGMEIMSFHAFRVTRNADLEIEEDAAEDLLRAIESELTRQRFGRVVRLEVEPAISAEALDLLQRELAIGEEDIYVLEGPLGLAGLTALDELDRPDLRMRPFNWLTGPRLAAVEGEEKDIFEVVRKGDLLVHHPYDSFTTSVESFISQAADDPNVLAIKQTLYRTSPDSAIIRALIRAATSGKQVVALVELKARGDEERNIGWARALEEAGVHVVYGVVGLKTHTKTALVVRREGDRIRYYSHVGTGNYNEKTARMYEDVGIFSAGQALGADMGDLFNSLTGYGHERKYRKLLVSPRALRRRILRKIQREARKEDGTIVMKMNSLVDERMIEALYEASQTHTPIDLIVRGICCLRPG
ncbi:MAG: polyphosphate kinase 1, partial [Acidimicrobiia bacterium]